MWYHLKMSYYRPQPEYSVVAPKDMGREFHPMGRPSNSALAIYVGQQIDIQWTRWGAVNGLARC